MPRPERCYKTALYSWSVEAVNWAASRLRPDATGLLGALLSPNPHHQQITLERSKSHAHRGDVCFVYCNMWPLPVHTGSSINGYSTYYINICACVQCISQQKNNGYLPDPHSAVPYNNSQSGVGLNSGILSPIYFGLLQFLKGNQSTGQRHFRDHCSNMRDENLAETHTQKQLCTHVTSRPGQWGEILGA